MKLSNITSGKIIESDFVKKRGIVMAYVILLIVLYMYCKFQSQYLYKELSSSKSELRIEQAKASTINAEKVRVTRESNLIRSLESKGITLIRNNEPPYKIE